MEPIKHDYMDPRVVAKGMEAKAVYCGAISEGKALRKSGGILYVHTGLLSWWQQQRFMFKTLEAFLMIKNFLEEVWFLWPNREKNVLADVLASLGKRSFTLEVVEERGDDDL